MTKDEIDKAISILEITRLAWADLIANEGQKISDSDAIKQTIECLKGYSQTFNE